MLVLVTGASGFVGSHITQTLLDEQIKVRVVSRSIKDTADIEWSNMAKIFITENLFKEPQENLCKLLEGVDIVIHAAWYAEPGKYLDSEKNLECLEGTLSLAKAASQVGVKKFVGIGTCLEYGESQERLNVDSPLDPISLYASSKAACYRELDKFCENIDMDFAWARLFYLYGAREDSRRLVPYLKRRLFEREIAIVVNACFNTKLLHVIASSNASSKSKNSSLVLVPLIVVAEE